MRIKDICYTDTVNYKRICMFIETSTCTFKCGSDICQNSALVKAPTIELPNTSILTRYKQNKLTEAIVFGGLEPFDQWDELKDFIHMARDEYAVNDDIVIYTGYYEGEIKDKVDWLRKNTHDIIIKYGRFIDKKPHVFDRVLGVTLASDNQWAERIC